MTASQEAAARRRAAEVRPGAGARVVAEALRRSGYTVVRGLLPPHEIDRLRTLVADVFGRHGWLAPGSDPEDLRPDRRRRDGAPGWWRFAEELQATEAFHRLAHHPAAASLAEGVVGRKVLHHGRRHLTVVSPDFWVPAHQEWTHVQGTADFFTAVVPLTPMGGQRGAALRVLEESGPRRVRPLRVLATRGVSVDVAPDDPRWIEWDLEPGDVAVFHSLTTREVTENRADSLALAALYRFQSLREPVVKASIKPEHYPRLPDWPQLVRGWSTSRWVQPPLFPRLVDYRMPATLETWHSDLPTPSSSFLPVVGHDTPD